MLFDTAITIEKWSRKIIQDSSIKRIEKYDLDPKAWVLLTRLPNAETLLNMGENFKAGTSAEKGSIAELIAQAIKYGEIIALGP